MSVTPEEVRRIARLARLRPDAEAVERLAAELSAVLEHVRVLEEVDVSGVDETTGGAPDPAPLRDPGAAPDPLPPDAPARGAPAWRDGFFLVPRLPALDADAPEGGDAGLPGES